MCYSYKLPENGNSEKKLQLSTSVNSLIIIGANGSGKSKLGAWIENSDKSKVHRISGQRKLNFSQNINLKNFSQAQNLVFYGSDRKNESKVDRWHNEYTTHMVDDYENVLAAILALKNEENDTFVKQCREAKQSHSKFPSIPFTAIDKLKKVWENVLPQRFISVEDSKFYATYDKTDDQLKYSAKDMSDGERSVLYLASQVICLPNNIILIVDEPELHLHSSIMNNLWIQLENLRKDILFIYITHDLDFAALHNNSEKIWVKSFDGKNWKLENIHSSDLPEDLLLQVLGSRKPVIFVEGEKNSWDTKLYSLLYPDYYIIPCGGCSQVIARTKAFNRQKDLHHCEVYGLIDRDFRSDHEINKYKEYHIFTLDVAEVENLFIAEGVVRYISSHMGRKDTEDFSSIKNYVIEQRFAKQINSQICQSVVAEIKYLLSIAEIDSKNEDIAKDSLNNVFSSIKYDDLQKQHAEKFKNILSSKDYKEIIKVFNEKNIANSIGQFFGIHNDTYLPLVINLIESGNHPDLVNFIKQYLPSDIPWRVLTA